MPLKQRKKCLNKPLPDKSLFFDSFCRGDNSCLILSNLLNFASWNQKLLKHTFSRKRGL